jgi:isoleucyl-tRNA synthetase
LCAVSRLRRHERLGNWEQKQDPFASSEVEMPPRTLRQIAMADRNALAFVPEKGRNRIGSMVEGRPDWVLSRQRAWGVPITLFVNRKSGNTCAIPPSTRASSRR